MISYLLGVKLTHRVQGGSRLSLLLHLVYRYITFILFLGFLSDNAAAIYKITIIAITEYLNKIPPITSTSPHRLSFNVGLL